MYDVIINSTQKYENLKNIRIRYLSYVYYALNGNAEITLNHPEDLVSLSAFKVKVSNMNKCVNLRNLYSSNNSYISGDMN